MSDFPEVFADIAQGAMAARALEPATGAVPGHTHETACLNCGTALTGPYCANCGQAAHVHRTLAAFFHDLLHGVFHFEGKILHTVPLLAWRPGRLTREYIDGRRASYISPVALFLFVVFVTFALFHALDSEPHPLVHHTTSGAVAQIHARIAGLEAQRQQALARHRDTAAIDDRLNRSRQGLAEVEQTGREFEIDDASGRQHASGAGMAGMIQRVIDAGRANPDLALFKLEYNAYKYSWLLIPLSVPFVWLLFPFDRRFHIYDHTVFATYSLSFMYVLLAVITLCSVIGSKSLSDVLVTALVLYAPFHMYRHLHETYALGFGAAVLRTMLLTIFATFTLCVWGVMLLAMLTAG